MTKAIIETLNVYRNRLVGIVNNDEVWSNGHSVSVFDGGKAEIALEDIMDGDFTKEQRELACQIGNDISEVYSALERIIDQIEELTTDQNLAT